VILNILLLDESPEWSYTVLVYILAQLSGLAGSCPTTHLEVLYLIGQIADLKGLLVLADLVEAHRISKFSLHSIVQHVNNVLGLLLACKVKLLLLFKVRVDGRKRRVSC
jgi:hypothetical protein